MTNNFTSPSFKKDRAELALFPLSRACSDIGANLLGVEVVVDQAVDDGRQLGLNQGVASGLGEASVRIKQPVQVFSDSN